MFSTHQLLRSAAFVKFIHRGGSHRRKWGRLQILSDELVNIILIDYPRMPDINSLWNTFVCANGHFWMEGKGWLVILQAADFGLNRFASWAVLKYFLCKREHTLTAHMGIARAVWRNPSNRESLKFQIYYPLNVNPETKTHGNYSCIRLIMYWLIQSWLGYLRLTVAPKFCIINSVFSSVIFYVVFSLNSMYNLMFKKKSMYFIQSWKWIIT